VKPEYKNSLVDVRCVDTLGRQFIVEMQMLWTDSFKSRILLNASKVMSKQVVKGEAFEELRPVYALSLVNAIFRDDTGEYYHRYLISDVADAKQLIEGMEFVFVELPKFKAKNITERRLQVLWLRFLTEINGATERAPADLIANADICEALDYVERYAYTDAELDTYDKHCDSIWTHKLMLWDSEKAGEMRKSLVVIANLLKKSMPLNEIVQVVGLSEAEILNLKKLPPKEVARVSGLSEEEALELLKKLNYVPLP
jgi:predicted transposase/invertase (TIGR01784 family)